MTSPSYSLDLRCAARGEVRLPGSKSLSNRALLLAALAKGSTRIRGLLDSDDTAVMIESLRRLGVHLQLESREQAADSGSDDPVWLVDGTSGRFSNIGTAGEPIDCFIGNSGLTIRTLLPAIVAAQAGTGSVTVLRGVDRMHERPIKDLVDGLRQLGAQIDYLGQEGYPPLRITGVALQPKSEIVVKGNTSSQFLTGLLQAAPQLGRQWQQPVVVRVEGELISRPYVDLSIGMLSQFGVAIQEPEINRFVVEPCDLVSPGELFVEGDASSASYFLAAGLLGSGPVRVVGAGRSSLQGDVQFAHALAQMGAQITWGEDYIESRAAALNDQGLPAVQGVDLDCNHIPDAAMTLVAVALYAKTPTRLRNIGSWRVKETDRIAAMAAEARKLGATVEEGPDFIVVTPPVQLRTASIHTYDDHRVAMSFALTSFVHAGDMEGEGVNAPGGETVIPSVETRGHSPEPSSGALTPSADFRSSATPARAVTIEDPACVNKTFPTYFEEFAAVCAEAVPVIAIDGPTASGKGTVASRVARALGYAYLDSGALYRLVALQSLEQNVAADDAKPLSAMALQMQLRFEGEQVWLNGRDVSLAIRAEAVGNRASQIATQPLLRQALLRRQRDFARLPGLVADGRDMGSVVFPKASLKVFLTASAEVRAQRRVLQLQARGEAADLQAITADLQARDARDAARPVAPLKFLPNQGVHYLDTSELGVEEAVAQVLSWQSFGA
jgi:3-phosphoshikimate 1-carboxyvinyltransferase